MPATSLVDEFMLIAHLDALGRPASQMSGLDYGLCGTQLCDLALAERVALTPEGLVASGSPGSDDAVADFVVHRVRALHRLHRAPWWIRTLGSDIRKQVLSRLVTVGIVAPTRGRLPAKPHLARRYLLTDATVRNEILDRIDSVVRGNNADADGRMAVLIQMIMASGQPSCRLDRLVSEFGTPFLSNAANQAIVQEIADAVRQNMAVTALAGWS